MMNNSLLALNIGAVPTFSTSRSASIIDVTLASDCLLPLLNNWHVVVEEDFCSDHRLLQFEHPVCPPAVVPIKNYQKTDWSQQYKCGSWSVPDTWSEATLDAESEAFAALITTTVDANTPSFVPKARLQQCYW
jgi:hypothetical protein